MSSPHGEPADVGHDRCSGDFEGDPLWPSGIPYAPGTLEYFRCYEGLREQHEPAPCSRAVPEFGRFAGRRALDVGSGNGYVLSRFAAAGVEVCGLDLTRTGIGLCGHPEPRRAAENPHVGGPPGRMVPVRQGRSRLTAGDT